eukprot:9491599-Pyramimonas_sp.AAC.1
MGCRPSSRALNDQHSNSQISCQVSSFVVQLSGQAARNIVTARVDPSHMRLVMLTVVRLSRLRNSAPSPCVVRGIAHL